jgi:hypothetical protein
MVNKTSFSWITVYLLNSTSTKYTANWEVWLSFVFRVFKFFRVFFCPA